MAKSNKRRKVLVFSIIAVALLGLTAVVILKKRDVVITVQTEKVVRRNLTEIVMANGRIQPVLQVKISAEVSGEVIIVLSKESWALATWALAFSTWCRLLSNCALAIS